MLHILTSKIDINSLPPGIQKLIPSELLDQLLPKPSSDIEKGVDSTEENIPNNKIYTNFKLPIEYLDTNDIYKLSPTVKNDLELEPIMKTYENNKKEGTPKTEEFTNKTMYDYLLQPKNDFGKQMINDWSKKYTTNIDFLKNSQNVLDDMEIYNETMTNSKNTYTVDCKRIESIWGSVKQDPAFLERYYFMEWEMLKYLNSSAPFLQILSTINLMSPLTTLVFPIIMLLVPFIILKFKQIPLQFSTYVSVLKDIAKNHIIGKTLTRLDKLDFKTITYLIFSIGFYFLQIYQSILSFSRYYKNIKKINENLYDINKFIEYSIISIDNYTNINKNKGIYSKFCDESTIHSNVLKKIKQELDIITPFSMSVSKLNTIGYLFRCYHELYSNTEYENALRYAIGFEGYIDTIKGLHSNICSRNIHIAKFNTKKNTKLTKQYYPPYVNKPHIKNTSSLKSNMVITGVNASGKTTILKTTCINIIFTQQFGCGFYNKCVLNPYHHIHSYLNIPDTSGRDSLFQAESRRCKEIIDIIKSEGSNIRHFCIFDELYSGTNPDEATKSAYAFLVYLSKMKNINFILTTHYTDLCKKINKDNTSIKRSVTNYKMDIIQKEDNSITYTYVLKKGICNIHGAVEILKNMNYPKEIIDDITQYKMHNKVVNK